MIKMKEFVLLFRMDLTNDEVQPTPEQMKGYMQDWNSWISDIAGKNRLSDGGNHFLKSGRVLKPGDEIVDKPYISDNVSVAGYVIISAKNIDEATSIAKRCPILNGLNTSVEIRETTMPG